MSAPQIKPFQAAEDQSEVIAFLRDPASHGGATETVEVIETHGAMVFLAGRFALKIKRAVKFPYMDYSTLERRHAMCRREYEINRKTAPGIYDEVTAVTRQPDGALELGGDGTPVEWAVRMRRFDQADLLSSIARRGDLDDVLTRDLAAAVAAFHAAADEVTQTDGVAAIETVISQLNAAFANASDILPEDLCNRFAERARGALESCRRCLVARAQHGHIRRCHGDLHLNNIVALNGKPVLFDAIEFNDAIATIDTLYDLAFLIMDLDQAGLRRQANLLLNRYLHHTDCARDLAGLAAMPLFLSCRAGIRAMVAIQKGRQPGSTAPEADYDRARRYFDSALGYLEPSPPRLVAVGGFSGTGKSTLSASLSPSFGLAPGAVHLRSDLERKAMFHAAETERLEPSHYSPEANARVYRRLLHKAGLLLTAGRTVVIDAVFSRQDERVALERLARHHGTAFQGLWLTAPDAQLYQRVSTRRGDASDATGDVIDMQLSRGAGELGWARVDAGGSPDDTLAAALDALSIA